MRVLIVEDEADVAANVAEYLESRGFVVDFAYDGVTGLHLAVTNAYDAIVLDLGLPGIDGLSVCTRIREDADRRTPILMLTARDTLADKIQGFESGTDDYLVKPFALPELLHRLKALHRRHAGPGCNVLGYADLTCDLQLRTVTRSGRRIQLKRLDFELLVALIRAAPAVVSRERLAADVWKQELVSDDTIRSHIYSLRQAIDKGFAGSLIHTEHGHGYALRSHDDA